MNFKKYLISTFLLFFLSCTFLGDDITEFLSREKVYNREETKELLRNGILANVAMCPHHHYAGLYAIETHIAAAANEPYYIRSSVENCMAVLSALPCTIQTDSDLLLFTNSYLGILRNCGLKKINTL